MKPLNRPMFKMGGPVKEGIMDGIKEPETIGGGTIVGEDKGGGRTGFVNPLLLAGGAITARAAPLLARAKGLFGTNVARQFTPVARQGITTGGRNPGTMLGGFQRTGPTQTATSFQLNPFGQYLASSPSGQLATGLIKGATSKTAKGFAQKAGKLATDPLTLLSAGLYFNPFKGEPEIKVNKEDIAVSQVGQKGKDTKDPKVETENKFQDDGTKKDTSVERLLKGVVTRARRDAGADTAIEVGRQLRTGEMSIKDPSGAIDVASQKFDKVSDLQSKVDLARIENELKKQQIKEQALATDKYIAASKATGMPVSFTARKALGIPTSVNETAAIYDKAQAGFSGTDDGAQVIASDWANLENKFFQGPLGNSEQLKTAKKTEEFKLSPESVILKSIEEIDGNDGIYTFGTQIYEYTNGVVKRLR
jgi:hypothetical protein